jgi:hypothetical protein
MMQTDVKSANTSVNAVLVNYRTRLRQILAHGTGVAGTVTFYDTATATTNAPVLYVLNFGTATQPITVDIPGEGILAYNGIYAVVNNVVGVTVCYG